MKKLGIFLFVVSFLAFSCEKVDYLEPSQGPFIDGSGLINIKVSYNEETEAYSTTTDSTTVYLVESNKMFIFSYETELDVDHQTWEFWDKILSHDKNAVYFYGGYEVKSIKLTIVSGGETYFVEAFLDLFPRYPGSPFYITDVEESGDKFLITAGIYKNAWYNLSGNYYFIGSITDTWDDYQMINPVDTNFRMSANGELHPAEGVGHWVKTQLELHPGDHNFGVARFYGNDPIWGNFKGSMFVADNQTLIEFSLSSDGQIIPVMSVPGQGGDTSSTPVVRFDINDDIIIYVNLEANFSSHDPWWSYLDHNEEWIEEPLLSVFGFPNWGKFYLDAGDLPLKMIFGKNPGEIAGNMSQSIFWDEYFQYLYLYFQNMQT